MWQLGLVTNYELRCNRDKYYHVSREFLVLFFTALDDDINSWGFVYTYLTPFLFSEEKICLGLRIDSICSGGSFCSHILLLGKMCPSVLFVFV